MRKTSNPLPHLAPINLPAPGTNSEPPAYAGGPVSIHPIAGADAFPGGARGHLGCRLSLVTLAGICALAGRLPRPRTRISSFPELRIASYLLLGDSLPSIISFHSLSLRADAIADALPHARARSKKVATPMCKRGCNASDRPALCAPEEAPYPTTDNLDLS